MAYKNAMKVFVLISQGIFSFFISKKKFKNKKYHLSSYQKSVCLNRRQFSKLVINDLICFMRYCIYSMGKKAINSYTRAQAVALINNSKSPMSVDKVAKRLNISKTCVFNAINKHKDIGEFVDKKRTELPQKLDEPDQ